MQRIRFFQFALAALATAFAAALTATPVQAQVWTVKEPGGGAASAQICPVGEEGSANFLCFRLECTTLEPLHFVLDVAGRSTATEDLAVTVGVDGGDAGVLTFAPHPATGYTRYTAGFDPRVHGQMVDLLERGLRASLAIDWPDGRQDVEMGLSGSADSLLTAMRTCPEPALPVDNPASLVLGEVVEACAELGGTVAMEPGFERREDLDGDGREDVVIDYAAAACSKSATLNCGSGGCTVGFFLARDEGYTRMFADVIRGYEVFPGGFLALDLHGTACGLYGFEACRKVFDIAGDSPVLVEEIAGPEAETMTVARVEAPEGTVAPADADAGADAAQDVGEDTGDKDTGEEVTGEEVTGEEGTGEDAGVAVVAVTEGVKVEPEGVAAPPQAPAGAPVPEAAPAAPEIAGETGGVAAGAEAAPSGSEPAVVATPAPASEGENLALAAVAPEAAPPVPTPAPPADSGGDAGVVLAAASGEDEGPTSRHDAGPAPAVPADARFRGDGTLVVPDEAGQ